MAKGYWKAVLAVAFFIVAGVCYGGEGGRWGGGAAGGRGRRKRPMGR